MEAPIRRVIIAIKPRFERTMYLRNELGNRARLPLLNGASFQKCEVGKP